MLPSDLGVENRNPSHDLAIPLSTKFLLYMPPFSLNFHVRSWSTIRTPRIGCWGVRNGVEIVNRKFDPTLLFEELAPFWYNAHLKQTYGRTDAVLVAIGGTLTKSVSM